MAVRKLEDTQAVAGLFAGWEETIIYSCMQKIMGAIYVQEGCRDSAAAILGDFSFFAGEPCEALVRFRPEECRRDFMIQVPRSDGWAGMIRECHGNRARRVERYAMKKEPEVFDRGRLEKIVASLPKGYRLRALDGEMFVRCRAEGWCGDLVSQYSDYETYRRLGIGVVALKDGELAAGASSYSRYREGIEIEIDTKEEYRRRGLAGACGAQLILRCLDRGLYPSWDAQNLWSVSLAEKLGYHMDHTYEAYEIWGE